MHRRPDVIEELNFDYRLQTASGHADRATDNVGFGQRRIKDTRAAKLPLQVRSDFENAALAFHFFQRFFA